ncbi:hypothetical protein SNE40_016244 [Patella caerulea]|uniref:HAUS augmin-like complex subunit 5 n=1 Tax=Patella caerulea TaxID=87958 RepID=A0AAN8J8X8_PATCE
MSSSTGATVRKKTETRVADVAEKLKEWAIEEMKFNPQGKYVNSKLPEYDDFKDICRGPMAEIWKFVTDNVYSVQTVKKVKGNLALKGHQRHRRYAVQLQPGSKFNEKKEELFEERTNLSGQLTNCNSDVKHLENDLHRLEKDILRTEHEYKSTVDEVEDLDKKSCLLEVFSRQCSETVLNYDNFSEKIQAKTKAITEKSHVESSGQPLFVTKSKPCDAGDKGLETVSAKNVRETCEKLEGFLNDTLQGSFTSDKTTFHQNKDQLWSDVERVLSEFRTQQIVSSLIANTQDAILNLRDRTNKINIRKDAENLRFQYEQGELTDVSMPSSALHSVRQLIEEGQVKHVNRFFESEKHKNQAWRSRQQLEEIKQNIDKILVQKFQDKPGELQLARNLIDTNLALAADRSGLHCSLAEAEQLRESISKGIQEKEVLQAKFYKIKTFKDLTEQKQNLIRVLAKQNLNSRSRLDSQQTEISNYIKNSLTSHHSDTKTLTDSLRNRILQEMDKFSTLSLPYLIYLYLDGANKVSGLDLSINHYHHPACIASRQPLQTLIKHLHFPTYKAPECLLPWCLSMKTETDSYRSLMESQNTASRRVYGLQDRIDTIENITELCSKVSEHDKHQMETLLPLLQKSITLATKGLKDCSQLNEDIQAWIDQPAQFSTPWLKHDKYTFKQLLERWTVLCTRLRQIQLQKTGDT